MNNYIVREAFIDGVAKRYCAPCKEHGCDLDGDWCRDCVITCVLKMVRDAPAADVEPVHHGRGERCFEDWRSRLRVTSVPRAGLSITGQESAAFVTAPAAAQKWKVVQTDDAMQR